MGLKSYMRVRRKAPPGDRMHDLERECTPDLGNGHGNTIPVLVDGDRNLGAVSIVGHDPPDGLVSQHWAPVLSNQSKVSLVVDLSIDCLNELPLA